MVKFPYWLTTGMLLIAATSLSANESSAPAPVSAAIVAPAASTPQSAPVPRTLEQEVAWLENRGREIADYNHAAWLATDLLLAMKPDHTKIGKWLAIHHQGRWWVFFGRFISEPEAGFLSVYTFSCPDNKFKEMKSTDSAKPEELPQDLYPRALAIDIAKLHMAAELTDPPYNSYVIREPDKSLTVYFMPASGDPKIIRYGGDFRVNLGEDGKKVLNVTILHNSVISQTLDEKSLRAGKSAASFHTHVLTDLPTETDIATFLIYPIIAPHIVGRNDWLTMVTREGKIKFLKSPAKTSQRNTPAITSPASTPPPKE